MDPEESMNIGEAIESHVAEEKAEEKAELGRVDQEIVDLRKAVAELEQRLIEVESKVG